MQCIFIIPKVSIMMRGDQKNILLMSAIDDKVISMERNLALTKKQKRYTSEKLYRDSEFNSSSLLLAVERTSFISKMPFRQSVISEESTESLNKFSGSTC